MLWKTFTTLSDKMRSMLRNNLSEVNAVIIDKINFVSNDLPLDINLRLVEIFACPNSTPFVEIRIIVIGDF